ncbi:hypothetical protein EMIT0P100_100096 [Pseudomonas sp. IT-P100]|jgi:hypothetical protein
MHPTHCFARALPIKSTSNFCRNWLEVQQNALILSEPRYSAVHASWNNATFLTIVSG